jgi:glucosamine-6-phosphate deaminase
MASVPSHALTVTLPALLRAREVMAVVPEARKAEPVRAALTGPISNQCPASALRTIGHATVYLEPESARLLQI